MLEHFLSYLTQEHLTELFQSYRAFGPLIAVLLPLIEAFLPFLPLIVFVVANTNSFGLWEGFILSWAGSTAGSILVFLIVRQYGQRKLLGFIRSHPSVRKLMLWVERHGFGPMFLLLCFPFTPSAAVNVVAGLSRIGTRPFILAAASGKLASFISFIFSLLCITASSSLVCFFLIVYEENADSYFVKVTRRTASSTRYALLFLMPYNR